MIEISDVRQAAETIKDVVYHTPLITNEELNRITGATVYLKLENLQKTYAFKLRGGATRIAHLTPEEKLRGVVAPSSGSHARGIAYAAQRFGIPATVVMPKTAPKVKIDAVKALGARVILEGDAYDDALQKARELQESEGLLLLPSFTDPIIIAGQGTIALEILEDAPEIEAIVAPIGGGGLMSGLCIVTGSLKPEMKMIGVQAEGANATYLSFRAGKPVELPSVRTIADGIATRRPGDINFAIMQKHVAEIVLVSDEEIAETIVYLLEKVKILVEGAGAAAVAALLFNKIKLTGTKVACIVTGGNIDSEFLLRLVKEAKRPFG